MKLNKISNTPPLAAIIVLLGTALAASGADWKVVDVPSLTNAFKQAAANDRICIAAGTYELDGSAMGSATYLTTAAARPLQIVGQGKKPGDTILVGGGEGCAHRVLSVYAQEGVVVSNLTITGGDIAGAGGGLLCTTTADGRPAVIVDCIFSNNVVHGNSGGAVGYAVANNSATVCMDIRGCWFENNQALERNSYAGALYGTYSTISDCTFTNNYCYDNRGGAVADGVYRCSRFLYNRLSAARSPTTMGGGAAGKRTVSPVFTDCYFEGNTVTAASSHGGTIYGAAALTNCVFFANYTESNGMIEQCQQVVRCRFENNSTFTYLGTDARYEDCVIVSNRVRASKGRIFSTDKPICNCLIVSNVVAAGSGIILGARLYNCTIAANSYSTGNTSVSIIGGDCVAVNCLFYDNSIGNSKYDISFYAENGDRTPVMTNCQWQAQYYTSYRSTIEANDPGHLVRAEKVPASPFAPTADNPYMIGKKSAARDEGYLDDNVRALVGDRDLAGKYRISIDKIDLGCYEYQAPGMLLLVR